MATLTQPYSVTVRMVVKHEGDDKPLFDSVDMTWNFPDAVNMAKLETAVVRAITEAACGLEDAKLAAVTGAPSTVPTPAPAS